MKLFFKKSLSIVIGSYHLIFQELLSTITYFVFCRGDAQYNDFLTAKSYYICMKLTQVSQNLYYYYLLAGQYAS